MQIGSREVQEAARAKAYATPLEKFQIHDPELFRSDTHWPWFERLRREDPVHYTPESEFGPYWSLTKHKDIVATDGNFQTFSSSSELGGITIFDGVEPNERTSFIGLDPPTHDEQRKVVAPMFSPENMKVLEPLIRERAAKILDELPVGEDFDLVDKVSVELTSQMLATLFDFPFEQRRTLPRISDFLLTFPEPGAIVETEQQRQMELLQMLTPFVALWNERASQPPKLDLISMLTHNPATRKNDNPELYFGNLILLIVAGSDTTRHSITGGILAMNEHPDYYDRLRANPALLESFVPEVIRWQSPVAYMRRTAMADAEIGGKKIKKGDKVLMWYVSGNRDDDVIDRPNELVIDRARPRQHASFGFGIHRCLGQRLAEMQLTVMWQEILKRFKRIEVTGEPRRMRNSFVKGYEAMPVRAIA